MMKTISIKRKEPRMNGGKVNRSGTIANRQDAKDAKKRKRETQKKREYQAASEDSHF